MKNFFLFLRSSAIQLPITLNSPIASPPLVDPATEVRPCGPDAVSSGLALGGRRALNDLTCQGWLSAFIVSDHSPMQELKLEENSAHEGSVRSFLFSVLFLIVTNTTYLLAVPETHSTAHGTMLKMCPSTKLLIGREACGPGTKRNAKRARGRLYPLGTMVLYDR